ncbi:amino acid permease [Cryptococcus deuterogattii 99/473]|uniref:Amino acid permease n=1 Tax=Cryptococcus deuterogattii Ram5 TaxID=1296110 RepID=A0A0D0T1Z1_9TREE|nr:amino acid permease [Cryptococcus deuterogattii LA55]KIR32562.1 amino acid permease [Cryptococcus deuterogattii MMRL2647]KIR39732.1 amino acid permease [Cryptococcus deuterogattii Ram5]KIR90702.1 amino acid permease [Cryptococcus deuterogattii CBS 10090]KIY57981.1 amino acid permease [Cryptococcus deuterogattii 99/473]
MADDKYDSDQRSISMVHNGSSETVDDDALLAELGYKSEFIREFGNLETFSFAMSIMGMTASIATTFTTPLSLGGLASVVWCWLIGSIMNVSLGASIAEVVSAYPTAGGLYTASAQLVPRRYRAIVGWVTGYLNTLGQIAGVASTEWGLSGMILAAVVVCRDDYTIKNWHQFVLFVGLLMIHGLLNSLPTAALARLTRGFVFINIGAAFVIVITLLACTPRAEMHPGSYIFTEVVNNSGWSNSGLAFMMGLLSVQWTMTDYDAAAHISEEVHRAAIAAPVAIFVAVLNTGAIGWILNIVLCVCAGDVTELPGPTGNAFLAIMYLRMGKAGSMVLWSFVCLVAAFTVQTALQANARTVFAFARDGALPDRGFFGRIQKRTQTPINAVWFVVFISVLMGVLSFASLTAVQAVFSMCAVAMDLSYIIPVICRRIFDGHSEVRFKPGPFYMGKWGYIVNVIMVTWTFFEVTILCFPETYPLTWNTFNYAAPITLAVMGLSLIWYMIAGRRYYDGPRSNVHENSTPQKEKSEEP